MPVEIVDDTSGSTSTEDGTIREYDIKTMKGDFINQVSLTAISPRTIIKKKYSFYFLSDELLELLNHYNGDEIIEIAIGIQVPDTIVGCGVNDFDESDAMAAIISSTIGTTLNARNDVADLVLINGYSGQEQKISDRVCCPGSKP